MSQNMESLTPTLGFVPFAQNVQQILDRAGNNIHNEPKISLRNTADALSVILAKILFIEQEKQLTKIDTNRPVLDQLLYLLKKNIDKYTERRINFTKNLNSELFRDPGMKISKKDAEDALGDVNKIFEHFVKKYGKKDEIEEIFKEKPDNGSVSLHKKLVLLVSIITLIVAIVIIIPEEFRDKIISFIFASSESIPPENPQNESYFTYIQNNNCDKAVELIRKIEYLMPKDIFWSHYSLVKLGKPDLDEIENAKNEEKNEYIKTFYKLLKIIAINIPHPDPPPEIKSLMKCFMKLLPKNDDPKILLQDIIECSQQ